MRILWLVKEEKQHGSAQVIVGGHYALLQAVISLFINPNSAPFPRFFDRAIFFMCMICLWTMSIAMPYFYVQVYSLQGINEDKKNIKIAFSIIFIFSK